MCAAIYGSGTLDSFDTGLVQTIKIYDAIARKDPVQAAIPFGDRTGRVARMLVIALLLRRTGYICAMGYLVSQDDEYKTLSARRLMARPGEECELSQNDPEAVAKLGEFMCKKVIRSLT